MQQRKENAQLTLHTATTRLLIAGFMTYFDSVLLFVFTDKGDHVASLPVVNDLVCGQCVGALEGMGAGA